MASRPAPLTNNHHTPIFSSVASTNEAAPHNTNTSNTNATPQYHHIFSKAHRHSLPSVGNNDSRGQHEGPPRKKQRISLRAGTGIQTTLDAFAKPPNKITAPKPGAPLVETINGVNHQLNVTDDELLHTSPQPVRRRTPQPTQQQQQPAKTEDKRTLRSQDDGPRLKSELATYFNGYDGIIFDAPQEEEFLTINTSLYITDDAATVPTVSPAKPKNAAHSRRTSVNGTAAAPPLTPQRSSSQQFNGSPVLNLDTFARTVGDNPEDPLTDEHFLKSHRRAERKEKQLRNIEKERAMHEKVQLERILDGLQGHDWLKVLGITGVTDGEARKYEAKRDYFIAEVQALVDKFKQWKDQEKKQRITKEAAAAAQQAEEDVDSSEGSVEPPSSDLNASAARQLQQETIIALKRTSGKGKERANHPTSHPSTPVISPSKMLLPPAPPSPEIPITSFYAKRHLRDAALGRSRHGRNVTAFGQPLPELEEREFELPEDYITEDALRANARERRRRKRESATASKASATASKAS